MKMKRKHRNIIQTKALIAFAFALVILAGPSAASALSVGASAGGKYAFSTFDMKAGPTASVDYAVGAGLALDTNVAGAEKVNFRIHLDYAQSVDHGVRFFSCYAMHRVSFSSGFGFGIFRMKRFRLWMGPELGVECQFNTFASRPALLAFNAGPVAGVNYTTDGGVTFGIELGMVVGFGWNLASGSGAESSLAMGPPESGYSGGDGLLRLESVARLSVLFRMGKPDGK